MKFRHHKYTWSKPFGSARHSWELAGPDGGIHFHVAGNDKFGDSAGLEFHHTREAWNRLFGRAEAPHHRECSVIGEPCWHDGTSLYASEHVWPMVKPMLRSGDHDAIFRFLEDEYSRHFDRRAADDSEAA